MTRYKPLYLMMLLLACDLVVDDGEHAQTYRVGCPGGSTSTGGEEPPPPPPPPSIGVPTPTAPCPQLVDGDVIFCPDALLECRSAVVVNAAAATGSGPLALHWHGTGEDPDGLLAWDSTALAIEAMVQRTGGLLVLPRADASAVARPGNPYPWWIVCGVNGTGCNRPDDFILADEIVACAVEQQLVDPSRLTSSGFSAGGIMTSHLVDRVGYLAGAVSWSGGLPDDYQPLTPGSTQTAVLAIHGGATDAYCSAPDGCYVFEGPSEALALDTQNAGGFAFLCDHQAGHVAAMGGQGAAFLEFSSTTGHAAAGYPFGYPGTGPDWMLNHYCYAPGTQSPWP